MRSARPRHLIETNVALVASDLCEQASADCMESCIAVLMDVIRGQSVVVLDDDGRVLDEYRKQLSMTGEPRIGDRFLKWVHDHQFVADICERVPVYARDADGLDYAELDGISGLEGFDSDDRKFLATALAGGAQVKLLNAVDSDWLNYRDPVVACGVGLEFVCGEASCVRGGS